MDRQEGSEKIDGRENEKMNKTREKKLETDIAVGQNEARGIKGGKTK